MKDWIATRLRYTAEVERDLRWYRENLDALVSQYRHKFVGVFDAKVCGAWDDALDGFNAMVAAGYAPGSFLLHWCVPASEAFDYTEWQRDHLYVGETLGSLIEKVRDRRNAQNLER